MVWRWEVGGYSFSTVPRRTSVLLLLLWKHFTPSPSLYYCTTNHRGESATAAALLSSVPACVRRRVDILSRWSYSSAPVLICTKFIWCYCCDVVAVLVVLVPPLLHEGATSRFPFVDIDSPNTMYYIAYCRMSLCGDSQARSGYMRHHPHDAHTVCDDVWIHSIIISSASSIVRFRHQNLSFFCFRALSLSLSLDGARAFVIYI